LAPRDFKANVTNTVTRICVFLAALAVGAALRAQDLPEIRATGVLRHLGIPYANFVTGGGDGLDVELMQGFAAWLGVKYRYVESDWTHVLGDLTGRNDERDESGVPLSAQTPIRGDVVAGGMTVLDWRKSIVDFASPAFPSAVWLVARADSSLTPIRPSGSLDQDIAQVRGLLAGRSVLALSGTCLDPKLYRLDETGARIRLQPPERRLNEMVPAILNGDAEASLLDVPDALIALERWPGEVKVIGPISQPQLMAPAFRKDSPELRAAFEEYYAGLRRSGRYREMVARYYPAIFRYYGGFFADR
jgi:hypothetical protein